MLVAVSPVRLLFSSLVVLCLTMLFVLLLASFPVSIVTALSAVIFATLLVVLFALTFVTTLLATATRPGDGMYFRYRPQWIIAVDQHFAGMRLCLRGFVPYHHVQARAGVQGGWERIVDKVPMAVLVLEGRLGYVQLAVAHIAHGNRPERAPAALNAAEVGEPGDSNLTGRRMSG
jgi:hypothetical protein